MKTVIWLSLVALVAASAFGQRAANPGHAPDRTNVGPPPARPAPVRAPFTHRSGFGRNSFASPVYPFFPGGYDYGYAPGYDYGYAPASDLGMVEPPPPYVIVQPAPPPPVIPAIREYALAPPVDFSSTQEQPAFAIALKDGSTHSALAVSVQDDTLHYVDPERGHMRVSLDAVDREATARLNRARKLQLQLPPPTAK